ncbi:MAG: DUF1501 domain-containing protein [Planctomycetota bacterium]|nr:MAG: DUF1501 domain-containing protein [Planctomycetota bacterium]
MLFSSPTRRQLLQIGALSLWGGPAMADRGSGNRLGTAQHGILIFLQGGPSQLDMWDPKPAAAAEVRGPFTPIDTAVPGLQLTNLLPMTARIADKISVVRSMSHNFNNHIAGTYVMLTGSAVQPNADREAAQHDAPGPGAILNYLRRETAGMPTAVSLPNWLSIPGPSNRMPGQYAGYLGSTFDPFLIQGEPHQPEFKPLSLTLPGEVPLARFESRTQLLGQIDAATRLLEAKGTRSRDRLYESAVDLLVNPKFRDALDLSREPATVRERYGMTKIGQSLLLARRLVEAGVTWVAFNEFNQHWDIHGAIEASKKNRVPPVDRAYSALVEDLDQRGLLDSTIVINTGEFGRTPVINKDAGRDHWPDVYSLAICGGGIQRGLVYGASDQRGAYPAANPVSPADLLATVWTCLGVDPESEIQDRLQRPFRVSTGHVVEGLLV